MPPRVEKKRVGKWRSLKGTDVLVVVNEDAAQSLEKIARLQLEAELADSTEPQERRIEEASWLDLASVRIST